MDSSVSSIDVSHTRSLCGGEQVEFQTRKMNKTTNTLYMTYNQCIPIAISSPISGNHHDLYQIGYHLNELYTTVALHAVVILLSDMYPKACL
ncbi:hypothetical protein [Dysgonomonas sp. ZJ279]|uniref:hypothetical protein n=1 Tax=Dysgonomonas sp. ZJ279 TaxID=2709796 RepID=UPI001C8871FE|nr:hypothetical protein [Dysgonomonas sp. ZJ279]